MMEAGDSGEDKYSSTKLQGGTEVIKQCLFLKAIRQPNAKDQEVNKLFCFWRPRTNNLSRKSSLLTLTEKQQDAIYALAGCADVSFVISRLSQEVRQALFDVYGIDKFNLGIWFKNRGRNPSKTPASGGTGNLPLKRTREADIPLQIKVQADIGHHNAKCRPPDQASLHTPSVIVADQRPLTPTPVGHQEIQLYNGPQKGIEAATPMAYTSPAWQLQLASKEHSTSHNLLPLSMREQQSPGNDNSNRPQSLLSYYKQQQQKQKQLQQQKQLLEQQLQQEQQQKQQQQQQQQQQTFLNLEQQQLSQTSNLMRRRMESDLSHSAYNGPLTNRTSTHSSDGAKLSSERRQDLPVTSGRQTVDLLKQAFNLEVPAPSPTLLIKRPSAICKNYYDLWQGSTLGNSSPSPVARQQEALPNPQNQQKKVCRSQYVMDLSYETNHETKINSRINPRVASPCSSTYQVNSEIERLRATLPSAQQYHRRSKQNSDIHVNDGALAMPLRPISNKGDADIDLRLLSGTKEERSSTPGVSDIPAHNGHQYRKGSQSQYYEEWQSAANQVVATSSWESMQPPGPPQPVMVALPKAHSGLMPFLMALPSGGSLPLRLPGGSLPLKQSDIEGLFHDSTNLSALENQMDLYRKKEQHKHVNKHEMQLRKEEQNHHYQHEEQQLKEEQKNVCQHEMQQLQQSYPLKRFSGGLSLGENDLALTFNNSTSLPVLEQQLQDYISSQREGVAQEEFPQYQLHCGVRCTVPRDGNSYQQSYAPVHHHQPQQQQLAHNIYIHQGLQGQQLHQLGISPNQGQSYILMPQQQQQQQQQQVIYRLPTITGEGESNLPLFKDSTEFNSWPSSLRYSMLPSLSLDP